MYIAPLTYTRSTITCKYWCNFLGYQETTWPLKCYKVQSNLLYKQCRKVVLHKHFMSPGEENLWQSVNCIQKKKKRERENEDYVGSKNLTRKKPSAEQDGKMPLCSLRIWLTSMVSAHSNCSAGKGHVAADPVLFNVVSIPLKEPSRTDGWTQHIT